MSARDRLDSYERDWECHLSWRNLPTHATSGVPGRYVQDGGMSGGGPHVAFREMPSDLRERVAKRLESVVARLVDEEHAAMLEQLRAATRLEAMRTLEELGPIGSAALGEYERNPDGIAPPVSLEQGVARALGDSP